MAEGTKASAVTRPWENFTNLDRIYLALVCGGCLALFYAVGPMLKWPTFLGCEASLLASSAPAAGAMAVVAGLVLCTVVATLLAGRLRYEAGFFAASVGLAAMANRGGTVGALLRSAGGPHVYRSMLLESIGLLGLLSLAWQLLALLSQRGWLAPDTRLGSHDLPPSAGRYFLASALQAVVSGLLLLLLIQADNQKQVMASVFIASLAGGLVAHQSMPVRPSVPYWTGPFLVAIAGYTCAMRSPGHWAIGSPANALAAVSPLAYSSVGTAGAIYGYWISRQWLEADQEAPA